MRMAGLGVAAALWVACAGAGAGAGVGASMCAGPDRLAVHPSPGVTFTPGDAEAAKAWAAPPALGFAVAPPVVEGRTVKLAAALSNDSPAALEAYTLSGGMIGYSTNPWNASLRAPRRPTPAVAAVEQFPMPEKITLPPGARVTYELRVCLDRYATTPGQTLDVVWSFELWTGRRTGTSQVIVP
jgi:hypothetical protein